MKLAARSEVYDPLAMLLGLCGGSMIRLVVVLAAAFMVLSLAAPSAPTAASSTRKVPASERSCTEAAKAAMPDGAGHDHTNISQHQLACRMRQAAFLSLKQELSSREDVVLGEMDVKADIAAVAIAFPQAGILFFDVSDPANPEFLSKYDGSECEGTLSDLDCGAFVDLSHDGRLAFLSVQSLTVVPTIPPGSLRPSTPGVEVVDISNPRSPRLAQVYPVAGITGVHTARSHVIPDGPASPQAPRAPGEYLFSNQNQIGVDIARVRRTPLGTLLTHHNTILIDEVHDTFIQNDPIDNRTYLYVAAGFDTGFLVYDVTDPSQPKLLAEWDLTPECEEDWYAHTIDVTVRGRSRYVTMPAELFVLKGTIRRESLQKQSAEDQRENCGTLVGNGDKAGPLWIIDASDFTSLGPADAIDRNVEERRTDAELKRSSAAALVTTWTNPAGRAGGELIFSPHNQQIVGDRIYLSHYHGGVYALDASAAFRGVKQRPTEVGFVVPSGEPTRPLFESPATNGLLLPFFGEFPLGRPMIWDMTFYKGYVLAADMTGGFYSFQLE